MANYKIVDADQLDSDLKGLADLIRSKSGTSGKLAFPNELKSTIDITLIDKTKISHFATGVINNVTEGQQVRITGITDAITGESFNLKGVVGILCPTVTTNYTTSKGKGAVVVFFKAADNTDGIGVAAYDTAFSVRANTGMKNNDILGISGNGFSFLSPATMWALMPAARWRWFAWG